MCQTKSDGVGRRAEGMTGAIGEGYVTSAAMMSTDERIETARKVMSDTFPIGVETR